VNDALYLQSTRSGRTYRLGRAFRIGGCLAHEAQDDQGVRCWIKQVSATDEAAIARLRYEAIMLAKLDHPGVVRLLDRVAIVPASFLFSARSQGEHCPKPLKVVHYRCHLC
jgi:hypothetical protein